jgi:hypothetical protein
MKYQQFENPPRLTAFDAAVFEWTLVSSSAPRIWTMSIDQRCEKWLVYLYRFKDKTLENRDLCHPPSKHQRWEQDRRYPRGPSMQQTR